ncbi:sigma-E processing peptidase SpoIIGA [Shouchella clausii]|uniref:sigma-E processing peptidase SpoIIGA n=1 Tax=Shouchella clausii TaxID=79880 RepID=UPI00226CA84F|nr:sigma-E processing peptidase SpoIIGA [Shouchella clausii]MCY1103862.1 sigma-E processing peptidase SpoIIGA [Shouchella clausii]
MTVYLDLIWLLNAGIDYLLLAATALLLKRRFSQWRLVLAALFASLIVFLMFTPAAPLFLNPVIKLIYSGLIVFIAFGYKRFSFFLQNLASFYFVTFVTGGGLFAMHYFFETNVDVLAFLPGHGVGGSMVSWAFVLIGFPLALYFCKQQFGAVKTKQFHASQLAEVEFWIEGMPFYAQGLIDTGNRLRDPLTKMPVMVAEAALLYSAFGKQQVDALLELEAENEPSPLMKRMRLIPYRAVGQGSSYMAALKPDRVKIRYQNEAYETNHVLIGLSRETLSPEQHYRCIVHPQIMHEYAS